MSIDRIIIYLMVAFAALGAIDRIIGNRFGLGDKFSTSVHIDYDEANACGFNSDTVGLIIQ